MEEASKSDGDIGSRLSGLGERLTVLSIDGGGIRGIIPGTILSFLESKLQVYILLMHYFFGFFFQSLISLQLCVCAHI